MKAHIQSNPKLVVTVLTLFSIICAVLLSGCGTTSSTKTDKFAFAYGIPEPDVPAGPIRTSPFLFLLDGMAEVTVVFVVEADGFVRLADASAPSLFMRKKAVETVRQFVFEPALLDGKPVRSVECIAWVFTGGDSFQVTKTVVWKDAREFLETRRQHQVEQMGQKSGSRVKGSNVKSKIVRLN